MNRVVMITGATRGIGFETAAEFLRKGDSAAISCRHSPHVLKAAGRLADFARPEKILPLVCDVRKGKDVKRVVKQCLEHFGRIDVLINNAGVGSYRPVEDTSEREWDRIVDTNLKGTFLFMRQIVPVMKKQRSGTIINISSALGVEGEANFSAYCASKFGVIGLTRAVADETEASGLRVYAVLPWAVNTTFMAGSDLKMELSGLLSPEYVAKRIFEAAHSRKKSGELFEVYR